MDDTSIGRSNAVAIATGLILLLIGGVLIVLVPCIGWVVGGAIVIAGLLQGGTKRKVWLCTQCGAIIERKGSRLLKARS